MRNKLGIRSHLNGIFALSGLLIFIARTTGQTNENQISDILIKRFSNANFTGGIVPKILKLKHDGIVEEPLFTLKSDPVKVQSDFKTVDITVLNKQREKENAKKVAIIQQDLQSRIKVNEPETKTKEPVEEVTEQEYVDPEEMIKKQARVKEDIQSRVLLDGGILGYRQEKEHYPVKRSDDDYYSDDMMPNLPPKPRMTTEAPKEEDSFFSIFESLFGSGSDESQTKKKAKPDDELMMKDSEDPTLEENIKTVGDLLKPLKPSDEPEAKTQSTYSEVPEYRIVNNFHSSQTHKQAYKPPPPKPNYHTFYRPTEKPFQPYRPPPTNGYEDYDLEEFMDKGEPTERIKFTSPVITTTTTHRSSPTTSTTTTTIATTTKHTYDNKLKFPSVQKKNDYINRNRYQEVKNESTEKRMDKVTERTTYTKPEIKTTTEYHYHSKPNEYHETKVNEVKPQKIQESPNFYNLINLPVRYSTKDTAIPLISTSYANTKIQGMGAHKYEKNSNGKYPNHKYEHINTSTTKRPNYWATKRTSTERTSFRPSSLIQKTTTKYIPGTDFSKVDYEDVAIGSGTEFGGYGSKMGVEIKTQTPNKQTPTTVVYNETTTKINDSMNLEAAGSQQSHVYAQTVEKEKVKVNEVEKISQKPSVKPTDVYEDYEYETYPANVQEVKTSTNNENYPPQFNFINRGQEHESESGYKKNYQNNGVSSVTPITEPSKPSEAPEYEYYDYEADLSTTTTKTTTTTTTTTPRYKIKYPNLSKDKIKPLSSEKVAVVVPSKDHDFYNENQSSSSSENSRTSTPETTTTTTTTSTTTITVEPKTSQSPTTVTRTSSTEVTNVKKPVTHFHKPSFNKEPAPVFEEVEESEKYTTKRISLQTTKKITTEKPTTEATVRPAIKKTQSKDDENNVNIVLVPTKETIKNIVKTEAQEKFSQTETTQPPTTLNIHKNYPNPSGVHQSSFDYTTEFTVGAVHGHIGKTPVQVHGSLGQGHFIASSISTNPYGDDEPFRPIPKPPGMTSSFNIVHEESQRQPLQGSTAYQKRPLPSQIPLEEAEPIHEPHEFIPSPQFHRPMESKPSSEIRPGPTDVDYDFEGIQTQPKPGQYVIFSKPQLNPEMNENQLKKKPEVSSPNKGLPNAPHFHEKVHQFGQSSQKHVVFNPKDGHFYQSSTKPKPSATEKIEQNKHVFGKVPEITDDRLSLQLVPPRGTQTEKPFDVNFVVPELEKKDSTVSYPRPHWEKNGKPSFLMNTLSNKNDMVGGRLPPIPPQMVPTLVPPSSIPPQRFRRPLQPHITPMRKNFNEAGTNVKPKPNLPNILPQFRPNAKVGSGPYHRPPGYMNSNRRNGMNRHHEKEHGNFPYHIQHPDKDALMHREYEMGPEIIPKFITNRGKFPSELWNSQGMQKRFGEGPVNIQSQSEHPVHPEGSEEHPKILRRLQRTPVTTLQMLKQMPGIKPQNTQISREESADPSKPLVPPIFRNYVDQPNSEENVYIVYPSKAPQKLQPDNSKVFIVSDAKSQRNGYNFTKVEGQHPLLNPNKRGNPFADKSKNDFPYGFVKPDDRVKLNRKQSGENEENISEILKSENDQRKNFTQVFPTSVPSVKDEKIDMNLHMQSNNQWNEVRNSPDSMVSVQNPVEKPLDKLRGDHYRFSEFSQQSESNEGHINPPSEYHTSIKDGSNSAFTLGAVMHTMSESNRKGQVASVSLRDEEKEVKWPKLKVNERISNGKIITVSMPVDVKQDPDGESESDKYQFQAPFQASSSISTSESHSPNSGWSVVKNSEDKSNSEDSKETTDAPTKNQFNFENFKPELLGGFKPIYELPEEPQENKEQEKINSDREQKTLDDAR